MITIEQALEIALHAHKGQEDLDHKPVILHPLAVGLKGMTREEIIVGFLHDVVEDSTYTFEDLRAMGVDEDIIGTLTLLTHREGETYDDYLRRIVSSGNTTAIHVKKNDLEHNMSRNDRSTEQKQRIYEKHRNALEAVNNGMSWMSKPRT